MFNPTAATRIAKSSLARQLTFFFIMTIKLTNDYTIVEIELNDDATIHEVANGFRAACYAVGYDMETITSAIPLVDYECR